MAIKLTDKNDVLEMNLHLELGDIPARNVLTRIL